MPRGEATSSLLAVLRSSLGVHRVLMHAFFVYLPLAYALSIGHDLITGLILALISFAYVGLWAITSSATNDFFDRFEDRGYGYNPFVYERNTAKGLASILILFAVALSFSFGAGLALDLRIVLLAPLGGLISWWYSDDVYLKRVFGFRLKSHYALSLPAIALGYTILFASTLAIMRVLTPGALPLLLLVGLAFLREAVRKDLLDIPKDSQAGNLTFSVLHGVDKSVLLIRILTLANFLALALLSITGFLPYFTMIGLSWIVGETIALRRRESQELDSRLQLFLDINPYFLLVSLGFLLGSVVT